MPGLIALVGSGEYLAGMEAVDRRLLAARQTAGAARVVCVPTAAAREGPQTVERWARLGLAHFAGLGAQADCAYITDRAAAADPRWSALLAAADLIYFSGGDPLAIVEILRDTPAWAAVEAAHARGAVYAGCSAGAMALGALVPNVRALGLEMQAGFGWLAGCLVLPHFDRLESFRPGATALMRQHLQAGQFLLGVDENTALVGRPGADWAVLGARGVSVITTSAVRTYAAGEQVRLPEA